VVEKATRSSKNISRFKKGNEHKCFSLWWVVGKSGVRLILNCTQTNSKNKALQDLVDITSISQQF
jgi:hypothetical protein